MKNFRKQNRFPLHANAVADFDSLKFKPDAQASEFADRTGHTCLRGGLVFSRFASFTNPRRHRRDGLSLLEVMLSIAILGVSMAAIGNLYFVGARSALKARFRSDANILCDTKMAELAAGVIPATSVGSQPIEENPDWSYSVEIQPSDQLGLLVATVAVQQTDSNVAVPVTLSIVRFIPDPDYDPEESE